MVEPVVTTTVATPTATQTVPTTQVASATSATPCDCKADADKIKTRMNKMFDDSDKSSKIMHIGGLLWIALIVIAIIYLLRKAIA